VLFVRFVVKAILSTAARLAPSAVPCFPRIPRIPWFTSPLPQTRHFQTDPKSNPSRNQPLTNFSFDATNNPTTQNP
jgi:hypothetical protein